MPAGTLQDVTSRFCGVHRMSKAVMKPQTHTLHETVFHRQALLAVLFERQPNSGERSVLSRICSCQEVRFKGVKGRADVYMKGCWHRLRFWNSWSLNKGMERAIYNASLRLRF
ncbi:hypothetical protein AD932_07845 [Gluconobacter oxydans]|nr:hypothetical protein AD932_07845 [Gluconobacter oxydans]